MSAGELELIRANLAEIKAKWRAGEIPLELFIQLRAELLADLSAEECSLLETSTPVSTSFEGALGPSGGIGSGLRTEPPSLSSVEMQPGSVLLSQWEIKRELGRGGFGTVYMVDDLLLKSVLAVKILDPLKVARKDLLTRFQREVNVTRQLVHPRIVRVYDYRQDLQQNLALVSMEYLQGHSIRDLNAHKRKLDRRIPPPLVLSIIEQTLEALVAAHAQKVIHRDVTPGNIFLVGVNLDDLFGDARADPNVKLLDFGIAALAERTELSSQSKALGTAAYVAPEVLDMNSGDQLTSAVDVYSAGAVAYELLTGRLALGNYESPSVLRKGLPAELDCLLQRLLDRNPSRRPTATEALDGFRALRETVELEWFRRERVRVVERDVLTAMGAEDEALLQNILDSLDPEEALWNVSKVVKKGRKWLKILAEERNAAKNQRREEEERLRNSLVQALELTSRSGGDDEVIEAIETLSDFLGAQSDDDQQLQAARGILAERAILLEERREEQRRIERENRLEADRCEVSSRELRAALNERNSAKVRLFLKNLKEVGASFRASSGGLIAEAEEWLLAQESEKEREKTQRLWEEEQLRRRNLVARLRKGLILSMSSDDEEKAQEFARELMVVLGSSAKSDRDLLKVRLWLEERESVRRQAEHERMKLLAAAEREAGTRKGAPGRDIQHSRSSRQGD